MLQLTTTDNSKVGIAIGQDSEDKYYVQTTDFEEGEYLSESIQEGLNDYSFAHAIALLYVFKYNMELFDWVKR